jgi:hypothetical protein
MTYVWSADIDSILSVGCYLAPHGIKNWALRKEDALLAISSLADLGIPVMGGDVYIMSGDGLKSSYDNWHINRRSEETDDEYLKRSIFLSLDYLYSCEAASGDALFAIVPGAG